MASPVSRVHPVACGESIGARLHPTSCFFSVIYREIQGERQNRRSAVAQASAPWLMLGVER
jgi:hypothetical protein